MKAEEWKNMCQKRMCNACKKFEECVILFPKNCPMCMTEREIEKSIKENEKRLVETCQIRRGIICECCAEYSCSYNPEKR